jgi:hypothetical protein
MTKVLSAITLVLALAATAWISGALAQTTPTTYTAQAGDGRILYEGPSTVEAITRCQIYVNIDPKRSCQWVHRGTANGTPFTKRWRMHVGTETGVWTWVAPTHLANTQGQPMPLTDLSHYLIYRQPPGQPAVPWTQIDGKVTRAVMPMGPEHYGACFWVVAVRKPATSPAVASDRSNKVCMDARGQPLPAT